MEMLCWIRLRIEISVSLSGIFTLGEEEMEKDFTSGGVLGTLIKFAIPVLVALFLQSLYGGVDLLIVGQFAETADVSGVSTGSLLMHTVTMAITGIAMGITVYVGQKIGEKRDKEAGKAIGSGIVLFVMIQGIVGALCVRVPVVLLMSKLPNTTLFHIGLGTPVSSVFQIVLCLGFMVYVSRSNKMSEGE